MKRRKFLQSLAATAMVHPHPARRQISTPGTPEAIKLKVEPDERTHDRTFSPPPIASRVDKIPHDWLTTFEDMESWDIFVEGAVDPKARRCKHRPLFRPTHVEITWSSMKDGRIVLSPPQPLPLPSSWNAIDFWMGGHPTDYERAPLMEGTLHCLDRGGKNRAVDIILKAPYFSPFAMAIYSRLVPKALRQDLQGGALKSIEFRIPESNKPYELEFYALTFYTFQPRRNYTRPATLPFPTQPDGVAPSALTEGTGTIEQEKGRDITRFAFQTSQGKGVVYTFKPSTGTLEDLTVSVDGERPFRPCVGGGLVLEAQGARLSPPYKPGEAKLIGQDVAEGRLTSKWEALVGSKTVRYELAFRMVNRSLVVEARSDGPSAVELRIGYPDYPGDRRAIEVPMLNWTLWRSDPLSDFDVREVTERKGGRGRSPAVLLAGDTFLSAIFDWYTSDASFVYSSAEEKGGPAGLDGGAYYLPVVDGERNPLREKLVLTASKEFHEVLPNIPNPPSPYRELMHDRVYVHGEAPGTSIARHRNLGIHGVATLLQSSNAYCDSGACRASADMGDIDDWIDNPSRLRGGLPRLVRRAEDWRSNGWLIGTYSNYMLMSPMFRVFSELPMIHDANGFQRSCWFGSVVPAPGEAMPYARRQASKMKATCGFQVLYADQATIFPIFHFVDHTPGVPGAGKFREAYEQIAQLYMTLRDTYQGPTFSEGGIHWMYSGLVDGNLARTQHRSSWWPGPPPPDLVDFNQLKVNPLSVDLGGNDYFEQWAPELRDKNICETLAYGKIGMWTPHTAQGQESQALSCRTYYVYHHAQKRYRTAPVERILYHDGKELVGASSILKQGKERMGRIYVRYQNGFESWTNLNEKESWTIRVDSADWILPPYGWFQRRKEAWGEFLNCSVVQSGEGRRLFVEDDGVLLAGAPGRVVRWTEIETDGTAIVRQEANGGARVINLDASILRVRADRLSLPPAAKLAVWHTFDLEGNPLQDGTVPITDGWADFSFLAQEQFALVLP